MPAATRSSAAAFELKSAALTLISVVVKTADLARLADSLHERLADTPEMFEHDPVVIDITPLRDDAAAIDFAALAALLRQYRMAPVAVKGGSAEQMAAALAAGYAEAPAGIAPARPPAAPKAAVADAAVGHDGVAAEGAHEPVPGSSPAPEREPEVQSAPDAAAAPAEADAEAEAEIVRPRAATVVIDRPLRSGQQVYARNADLVVLAVVSFGAEVIADGNIHVYAPLRGRALAGARGDTNARIFTTCMQPQLVSIAGTYRTTETELPAEVLGKPAQVRMDGDRLVIEPLGA